VLAVGAFDPTHDSYRLSILVSHDDRVIRRPALPFAHERVARLEDERPVGGDH
jgi:hypothetical protein